MESDNIFERIAEAVKKDNRIVTFTTKTNAGGLLGKLQLNPNGITGNHAYRIVDCNPEKGTITISNPWNNNQTIELSMYEWILEVNNVTLFNIL